MHQRYRARRLALQGLCCLDVQGEKAMDMVEAFLADSREPPETVAAAHALLSGTFADRGTSDELLARHSRHWDLSRLALVDRNILRLAVHELRDGRTPYKVAIAEAIKLAKEFSTAESSRFVNGVLDAVAKSLRKGPSKDAGDRKPGQTNGPQEEA